MTESFDFAVKQSTGHYITTLGDDDAVMFCFRSKVDHHFNQHPSSILTWYRGAYFWNDTPTPGRLIAPPWVEPSEILFSDKLDHLRSESVSYNDLPNIYNSFIPREVIVNILELNSNNFGSYSLYPFDECCAPDIFSGFQNTYYLHGSYFLTSTPITLSGISARSNGQSSQGFSFSKLEKNLFNSENVFKSFSALSARYLVASDSIQMYNASIQVFAHKTFSDVCGHSSWSPTTPWLLNLLDTFIHVELPKHPDFIIDFVRLLRLYDIYSPKISLLKDSYKSFLRCGQNLPASDGPTHFSLKNFREDPNYGKNNKLSLQYSGCLSAYQAVLFYMTVYNI